MTIWAQVSIVTISNAIAVLYIFPDWFKVQYGSAVSNLIANKARLTIYFDYYETLLDLMRLESIEEDDPNDRHALFWNSSLPRGLSLMVSISSTGTYTDAGICANWCVCQMSITVNDISIPVISESNQKHCKAYKQPSEAAPTKCNTST